MNEVRIAVIEPVGGHGGMNFYDYGLSMGLAHNQVEVYFFTSNATKIMNIAKVFTMLSFSSVWSQKNRLLKGLTYFKGLVTSLRICKQKNIRIVHLHIFHMDWLFYFSIRLCRLFKFKIVVTIHDITTLAGNTIPTSLLKKLIYRIDKVIVHNTFSLLEIRSLFPGREYNLIPHGNYIPFVKRVTAQTKRNPFKILFFGQIKQVKGLDILLEALHIIKERGINCELTIAGKLWKESFEKYENIINEKGLAPFIRVNIKYIPDDEIWDYFNDSNLVVLPYKKIYQSGVLLMAMSYGRAVLTSNLPAFTEIIKHNHNGYLFINGDPISLANTIESIIKCNNIPDVEKAAYETVSEIYDWNRIGLLTKNLYCQLLTSDSYFHTAHLNSSKQAVLNNDEILN